MFLDSEQSHGLLEGRKSYCCTSGGAQTRYERCNMVKLYTKKNKGLILICDMQLWKDMFMQKFTNNRTYVKLVFLMLECSLAWKYCESWLQISEIFGCLSYLITG